MRTLCFALGLLLLVACCCDAMPEALQYNTAPANCCFRFYKGSLPSHLVSTVTKTHSSCRHQAFIVQTIRGRQICYSQTFQWALNIYNQLRNTKGSSQQH
ncbi:C-C motif chemokine 4-like [Pempheris klunzingeri]|uniref:C-C motif chemokine 4-like n=1 Tax=Pempheris klunzingeri TaxID=3127111 RepID=UPI00397FBC97